MSIVFYRNRLNREMKRFGKFSRLIVGNLEEHHPVSMIYNPYKQKCLEEMSTHETIILITHGSPNELYHKYDHKNNDHQVLLNKDNAHLLKGKKVISISCATARSFGKEVCENDGCKVFLGFSNKIHFDKKNKKNASRDYRVFIGGCYKDAFSSVIEQAILNNWSFDKIKIVLGIELRNIVVTRAINMKSTKPNYFKNNGLDQAVFAVTNLSNNIMLFGDSQENIV
ncbi:hypothetical protein [Paenibacillus segetis]|uniref:Peptidase C80 family protein n=1 Tax=Paenibacillus segetis TaxID=1325360 RepID=A0ABQ1Y3K0_9BACL|nr:hypothetical protein [Paenibacillus segetis]GGH11322.1 hypothetical protein GCM10008013_03050 [Paenibacillus segetis]